MLTQTTFPHEFPHERKDGRTPEELDRILDALVAAMTVEEKIDLLSGGRDAEMPGKIGNAGYMRGVPRLGIPEARMYDGPTGVTAMKETTGLPTPTVLASTWSEELAYRFGVVAGRENAAVAGNYQLGTQADLVRTPHFVRSRDMKGEDPFLVGRLTAAEVRGVQDQGVVAVLKHFAVAVLMAHGPLTDVQVDEQTLHELYLRPFEMTVAAGGALSVMSAYNHVNGHYATANEYLNIEVLRNLWGFEGSVMSDWGATHGLTIGRGMDIELPLAAFNDRMRILRGLREGVLSWDDLDGAARHVIAPLAPAGLLSLVTLDEDGRPREQWGRTEPIRMPWRYDDLVSAGMLDEHADVAREIARNGIVLAENARSTLPLPPVSPTGGTIAFVGPGAVHAIGGEGQERSFGRLERMVPPWRRFADAVGDGWTVVVEPGVDWVGSAIPADCWSQDAEGLLPGLVRTWGISDEVRGLAGPGPVGGGMGFEFQGVRGELDDHGDLVENEVFSLLGAEGGGAPAGHELGEIAGIDAAVDFTVGTDAAGRPVTDYRNGALGSAFSGGESFTWRGYLCAPEDGAYTLKLEAVGGEAAFLVEVDGEWTSVGTIATREGVHWPWDSIVTTPEGMSISDAEITLRAGERYAVAIHATHHEKHKDLQIRAAWVTPTMRTAAREAALAAARDASHVVLFASDFVEGRRWWDQFIAPSPASIELPPVQADFLEAVAAEAGDAALIAVVQTGSARVLGPWIERADAVVITHLAGQEGAEALVDILLGRVNPSGKLVVSWPAGVADSPITDTPEHTRAREQGVPGESALQVTLAEGIFTGYRWFDRHGIAPRYGFGHGLSYTSFAYSDLTVAPTSGGGWDVSFSVTNTGACAGTEIAQVYVGAAEAPSSVQMAHRKLVGFARVEDIAPGETRTTTVHVSPVELAFWNTAAVPSKTVEGVRGKWQLPRGGRDVYVGASVADVRLTTTVSVPLPEG